jgi:two-component system phosphate regulon sensor histidine kinase PhoR
MMDTGNAQEPANDLNLGYKQALIYGQDLARLYTLEKAKRRELELANQKLQAILETAPNGLAVLDETMVILETNPRFEALVEQNENCVGHSLVDVFPSEELVARLESVFREGKRFAEVEVTLASPINRTLHITGAPLSAGGQVGWVISLHDITEHKRLEGLKEEFINIAAHELRTPLAIILGYTSVLHEDMEDSDNVVVLTALDAIIKAADRLTLVIDELVGFAAAKSRSTKDIGADHFDLSKVIHHAVNSVTNQANLKNVEIVIETNDRPVMVTGDRVILAQVIGHLLDNAIKFNQPSGRVYVQATQSSTETTIEVKDTGMGIPLTDLDKIFDLFYQVEGHMTRAQGGLGLGLAIAQRGVELHGGHITAESTLGQGSCFRIVLPVSVEQIPIPLQNRLDTAHQQTLAYGRDLARAFAAQQALIQRLHHVSVLARQILSQLEHLSSLGTKEEMAPLLDEARALTCQLIDAVTSE